jgi:NDP-sugar pyrophosphorylase family protein
MKAMIFAAGMGKRLGEITKDIPKALVSVNNKSILQLAVEKLHYSGFTEIIVNVHHFADMVTAEIEKLNTSGFNITISDERDKLLDTGGGLYKAKWFFDNEPFLVYNVDIVTDLDPGRLLTCHMDSGGIATLAGFSLWTRQAG